jgi:hypothetical protein
MLRCIRDTRVLAPPLVFLFTMSNSQSFADPAAAMRPGRPGFAFLPVPRRHEGMKRREALGADRRTLTCHDAARRTPGEAFRAQ